MGQTNAGHAFLTQEAVDYLKADAERRVFNPGEYILRRGEEVRHLFVIIHGEAEVRLQGDNNLQMTVARLPQLSTIGEMGLVTGDPASADVVAVGQVEALLYPGESFQRALAECEALRRYILSRLVDSLRATTLEAWSFFCRAQAMADLTALGAPRGSLVAHSPKMKKVEAAILELAASSQPLTIRGEAGSGKLFVARRIHEESPLNSGPFIVIDCSKLDEEEGTRNLLGSDQPSASGRGLAGIGAIHLADRGTLVLRRIDALGKKIQVALEVALAALESDGSDAFPRIRLMATATQDLVALSENGSFEASLARRLQSGTLDLPALADRRQDVLDLARIFLDEFALQQELRFSRDAEHALLSHRYRHGNVQELREAVKLAALFAEGGEVRDQHIFTGPKQQGISAEIDLTRSSALQWLLRGNRLLALKLSVFASFVAVTVLCLAAAAGPAGRLSNALVWGLWEPALILLFLLAGRVWCTVCPLAVAGQVTRALAGGMDRAPPGWMKKGGLIIACVGFAAIIWIEQAFHMTRDPRATGYLLAGLMGLAIAFAVLYQREVWCRYLCPLGTLGASLTAPAILQVRANASVCATNCTTHECFKGSPTQPGCSVFHHPLYASDGHACKLCLNCIAVCPHGSAKLYLRTPLQAVWRQLGLSGALAPFSLSIFALSIVMLAYQETSWIGSPASLAAFAALSVAIGYLLSRVLPVILTRGEDRVGELAGRVGFSLMVLAWGPLMAYQLYNIPVLEALSLRASEGSLLERILPAGGMAVLPLVQAAAVLAAWVAAALVLRNVRRKLDGERGHLRPWGWRAMNGLCLIYAVAAMAIVLLGGLP